MPFSIVTRSLVLSLLVVTPREAVAAASAPTRSAVVFSLETKGGFPGDSAELLTEIVVQALRDTRGFGRVVAAKELEKVVNLNLQKEMMGCTDNSCIAEIAGQLGVEFLVSGSIGRLGRAAVLNLKMLDTRTALSVASVSQVICGEGDEALIAATRTSVKRLVQEAHFATFPDLPPPSDADCPSGPVATTNATVAPAPAEPAREGTSRVPRLVAGGLGMVLGGLGILAGVGAILAGVAVAADGFLNQRTPPWGPESFNGRLQSFGVIGGGLGAGGALLGAVALVAGIVGIAVLISGITAG